MSFSCLEECYKYFAVKLQKFLWAKKPHLIFNPHGGQQVMTDFSFLGKQTQLVPPTHKDLFFLLHKTSCSL